MKIIFSLLLIIQCSFVFGANESDTLVVDQNLYLEVLHDSLKLRINEITTYSDSLSTKKGKKYLFKLDSLSSSENTIGDLNVAVYAWERLYQWYNTNGNSKGKSTAINNIYSAWVSGNLENKIEESLSEKLIVIFETNRDFEKVYFLTKKKYDEKTLAASQKITVLEDEKTSLEKDLTESNKKLETEQKSKEELNQMLLIGAVAAGTLLLLLIVILFVQKSKFKKKLSQQEIPASNIQDIEVLMAKLKDVEREKEQLKKVASIGIDKLNELDSTINNALGLLTDTTEELEMTIQESTNLTETSRNELPVALYMSQKNLLHRIGNQVVQDLKNCSEILKRGVK